MKKLQQLCLAGVFTLSLATATLAGDIATGGKSAPPPPPPGAVTTSGQIPTDAKDDAASEYQLLKDIAVDLLRTMLSLF